MIHDRHEVPHVPNHDVRAAGAPHRPFGSTPLSLERRGMLSMSELDDILEVDTKAQTITVQGGARVSQILEELKKHGKD